MMNRGGDQQGRRWSAATIAVLLAATLAGGGSAYAAPGGQDSQVPAPEGLIIQTDFVGPADNGEPPADLENATVVYYRGTANGTAVVWISAPAATVLVDGSVVEPLWSGRLSAVDIADVTAFLAATESDGGVLADSHYDYDCYTIAYTPDVTAERVWGYGKHVCSGDDVEKFRVKTYLDSYSAWWTQRLSSTSRWAYPPITSVGRTVVYRDCVDWSGSQEWRTRARGSVNFTDGYGISVEIDTSDTGEGPCP
ncbi:MAG: hypothetical protein OXD34_16130 [bacterium]|nr:hypothetical protein [bacterium]